MIEVAAAIIQAQDGKILICQRGAGGSCAHLWEFPGGKRERNETWEECVSRECQEELKIKIQLHGLYAQSRHIYPDQTVYLRFFRASVWQGVPEKHVHEKICWVTPHELTMYAFCPADRDVVARLAREG